MNNDREEKKTFKKNKFSRDMALVSKLLFIKNLRFSSEMRKEQWFNNVACFFVL